MLIIVFVLVLCALVGTALAAVAAWAAWTLVAAAVAAPAWWAVRTMTSRRGFVPLERGRLAQLCILGATSASVAAAWLGV